MAQSPVSCLLSLVFPSYKGTRVASLLREHGGVSMANAMYDKSIGSKDRSVVSATKLWVIILGIVLLLGIGMILFFFSSGTGTRETGAPGATNSASNPGP